VSEDLADIAAFVGVPTAQLQRTIDGYNAGCAAGYDPLFGKDRDDLLPIGSGPYYIIRAGVDMIATHGGIRVNTDFQALDKARRPIAGLYIAGTDVGGLDADAYNMTMSGHAFGFAVNTGRLAGEAAAQASR
jgi:fumarate reductase flavoprotein subunit